MCYFAWNIKYQFVLIHIYWNVTVFSYCLLKVILPHPFLYKDWADGLKGNACQLHYTCLSVPLRLIASNVLVPFSDIHIAYLSHKVTKKHKKNSWLSSKCESQGEMSQLRLRVSICYRLLFVVICNVTPYFADSIWMNVQERGEVLQGKMLNNTGTTLLLKLIIIVQNPLFEERVF